MEKTLTLIPTILCGGAGSRLWPLSREQDPKPFIRLGDGQSLMQKAFLRACGFSNNIITVTNRDFLFRIEDDLYEIDDKLENVQKHFILEPFGRNTAAAIAAASLYAKKHIDPDAILLVLTADHLINDVDAFSKAVEQAIMLASQNKIVTFGIHPTLPETAYGYIEHEGHDVIRFVEKPTFDVATQYIAAKKFLWNAGIFCFKAAKMLEEMQSLSPSILEETNTSISNARFLKGDGFFQLDLQPIDFEKVPSDSIDYAIMEKTKDAAVVPCDIGWSDIGCWRSMGNLIDPDENNNRIQGEALTKDTKNCTIFSGERVIGVVGLDNTIIIDTADALLVASKDATQDVKAIFTQLKAKNHEAHKLHKTAFRPWGTYTVLEEGENFKIKRIEVKPGASLSLQMHHHRSEHWIVVAGKAKVVNGDKTLILDVNESTFIPQTHKHRLENIGTDRLVLIEVQTGAYLGEDDIVRFQDNYGRT
jgi:mannose-1-phosphate guanylyltransferase/mannose-6-phosphate isomerase